MFDSKLGKMFFKEQSYIYGLGDPTAPTYMDDASLV